MSTPASTASSTTSDVRLRIVEGDGYVTRRPNAVLYTTVNGLPLIDAFLAADERYTIEAVTECAETADFADGPFVVISWSGPWRVVLYGDVEVTSDHASLRQLSAASSSTWIERQLRETTLTIGVSPTNANDYTNLRSGVVTGGGFALMLTPIASPSSSPDEPASTVRWSEPVPADTTDPDATASAPSPVEGLNALIGRTAAQNDVTIDVPAEMLRPSGTQAPREGVWQVRFVGGATVPVGSALVLGRRPTLASPGDTARLVAVDCSLASANHLRIEVDADDQLVVTDLGSSNGTWIATTGDGQPIQLERHQRVPLEVGTPVQIGSKVFVAERR